MLWIVFHGAWRGRHTSLQGRTAHAISHLVAAEWIVGTFCWALLGRDALMIWVEVRLESQRAAQSEGSEMHPVVKLMKPKLQSLPGGSMPVRTRQGAAHI